ncbi:MAG: hypothetical protein ACHQ49_05590, partial [Elusimicrobiota bacterium]
MNAFAVLVLACLPAGAAVAAEPSQAASDLAATITVSTRVVHQMLGGVGASWHSIIRPTVGPGGSAFGGSPPVMPRREKLWSSMEREADRLDLKFIRAEIGWRQWQPQKGRFTWDSPEMKILDRILAWSRRSGGDVVLQSMWTDVDWLAFPEFRGDPTLVEASAPADLDAFAQGWVDLLRELREKRGYTNIRWINLANEPNYYWWLLPPDADGKQDPARQSRYLAEAMRKVRAALRRARIPVRVMGPDFTDLPVFENLSAEPWFAQVDDVDFHSYCSSFDWEDPKSLPGSWGYRMGTRLEQTLVPYRAETAAAGKGLYLSEVGSQCYGWKGDSPLPGGFKASLKD